MIIPESITEDFQTIEYLTNACEQALLLLNRPRFEDDAEAKVVRAVLRSALEQAAPYQESEQESQ